MCEGARLTDDRGRSAMIGDLHNFGVGVVLRVHALLPTLLSSHARPHLDYEAVALCRPSERHDATAGLAQAFERLNNVLSRLSAESAV